MCSVFVFELLHIFLYQILFLDNKVFQQYLHQPSKYVLFYIQSDKVLTLSQLDNGCSLNMILDIEINSLESHSIVSAL